MKKISAWFSQRSIVWKVIIVLVGLMVILCVCSVPLALIFPSGNATTPAPQVTAVSTKAVSAGNTSSPVAPSDTPRPTSTPKPTKTPVPTATPMPTATPNPNLVEPGTYLVNTDIHPGIYKGQAGTGFFSSCYWERLKDLTGSLDSIIANDDPVGQFYVEVKPTDYAFKTSCEVLRLESIPKHSGEYPKKLKPGMYLVGSDIQPGTYKGQAGSDTCYWERLRNVSGGLNSIIANDNATGQFYIQVRPTDFALKTTCDLEWVKP